MGGEESARHLQDASHVEDVLNSRMYPFRLLQCCLVTGGGGVLILNGGRLLPRHQRERRDPSVTSPAISAKAGSQLG